LATEETAAAQELAAEEAVPEEFAAEEVVAAAQDSATAEALAAEAFAAKEQAFAAPEEALAEALPAPEDLAAQAAEEEEAAAAEEEAAEEAAAAEEEADEEEAAAAEEEADEEEAAAEKQEESEEGLPTADEEGLPTADNDHFFVQRFYQNNKVEFFSDDFDDIFTRVDEYESVSGFRLVIRRSKNGGRLYCCASHEDCTFKAQFGRVRGSPHFISLKPDFSCFVHSGPPVSDLSRDGRSKKRRLARKVKRAITKVATVKALAVTPRDVVKSSVNTEHLCLLCSTNTGVRMR
jgi:chemotaxis protein histidine kinase CheA